MIASRFELVIFDCDGVLVDSEPIINQAHAHVLTACGYPINEKDLVERFCGMSDPEMLKIIERELSHALPISRPSPGQPLSSSWGAAVRDGAQARLCRTGAGPGTKEASLLRNPRLT